MACGFLYGLQGGVVQGVVAAAVADADIAKCAVGMDGEGNGDAAFVANASRFVARQCLMQAALVSALRIVCGDGGGGRRRFFRARIAAGSWGG